MFKKLYLLLKNYTYIASRSPIDFHYVFRLFQQCFFSAVADISTIFCFLVNLLSHIFSSSLCLCFFLFNFDFSRSNMLSFSCNISINFRTWNIINNIDTYCTPKCQKYLQFIFFFNKKLCTQLNNLSTYDVSICEFVFQITQFLI